jgi:hypothetical protein
MFVLTWLKNLNTLMKNIFVLDNKKLLKTSAVVIFMITVIALKGIAQDNEVELTIEIIEKGSKKAPAAWINVQGEGNDNINGWYKKDRLKGFPIFSSTKVNVPPGLVTVTAWNSNCDEVSTQIKVTKNQPAKCKLILVPRFDMHKLGYFSFDAHDHMDGDNEMNRPPFIYPYCAAMGIDHLSVCQLWFHTLETPVSYDSIQTYLKAYSTPTLDLKFGVESPKLRYGHTWTVNHPGLTDPLGDYLNWHDVDYFDYQVTTDTIESIVNDLRGKIHPKWQPPFVNRLRNKSKGAFSAAAHPTRWWHHGSNEVLPGTNITADLAFDLIAARSYDGLTVMGDSKDNISYQNLWFTILNLGYRLVPVAETDGDIAHASLGNLALTYVWTGGREFDFNALTNHLKKGHTTLSGKAVMVLAVDGKLPPGSVLPADGKSHTINVDVFSEPASDEYISYLVLYRNGKVIKKIDLREHKKRSIKHQFNITENETAWYVVKSYGRVYPKEDLQFDVMAYAEQSLQNGNNDFIHNSGISMTAPVYFNAPGWAAPKPITSHIFGKVLDQNDQPLKKARIEIWNIDEKLAELTTDDSGGFEINAPATIDVRFTLPDGQEEQQWLFYEYPPLLDLIEDTYTISWAKKYPNIKRGQIPWEAFHYNEMLDVLSKIHWTIIPNGKIMLPGR